MAQILIDEKLKNLNDQIERTQLQAKLLKAQAKLAASVKQLYPNAVYTVQPNGISGWVDASITADTPKVIKKHHFNPSAGRFGYYFQLTVRIGKEKVDITSELSGWVSPKEVEAILDLHAIKTRKTPIKN